jgi:putative membrane protein insertion efficiency factor
VLRRFLIGCIRLYQVGLSPLLGPCCRFSPSCSHYACACIRDHGALRGSWLTLRRLLRCHPWHPGGLDLPPPPRGCLSSTALTVSTADTAGASSHPEHC